MKYPYEYLLHFWGGGITELGLADKLEYQWFNTEEERSKELERLKELVSNTKSKGYAFSENEGELVRHKFTIKSLIYYEDHFYWVYNNLGYGFYNKEELINNDQDYLIDWKWGIQPPYDINGNEIDLDLEECKLLNTSLIIEEPQIVNN